MNSLPYAWRISKYDPALRDSQGHYLAEDWTFFAQIGRFFHGKQLTHEDYAFVENAYVRSALRFLGDAGLSSLRIRELSVPNSAFSSDSKLRDVRFQPELLQNESLVGLDRLADVIKLNLREVVWCKLQEIDKFYLHFGWDYYIYIGSMSPSPRAISDTTQDGLYVEAKFSPYL